MTAAEKRTSEWWRKQYPGWPSMCRERMEMLFFDLAAVERERDALKARLAEAARFVEYMSICPACGASACEPECSLGKDSPVDYAAMMRARRIRDAWLKGGYR